MKALDVEDVVRYHSHRFAASTGIDQEDLAQEARLAAHRAIGRYDPHLSSVRTYVSRCVYNHLCSISRSQKRRIQTVQFPESPEGDVAFEPADPGPSPEDSSIFCDLIRQLPEDARTVVQLVLSDVSSIVDVDDVRDAVVSRLGWAPSRISLAVAFVADALNGEGMFRRRNATTV